MERQLTKSLANCKPTEFLKQTVRIRKYVQEWLTVTKILEIRKRMPQLKENASEDEKKTALREQISKNLSAIFESALEDNAEKTLGVLALLCFVEPENVDDYPMSEYFANLSEVFNNQEVITFFTSLANLVK